MRNHRTSTVVAGATALAVVAVGVVSAHMALERSLPEKDAVLTASPPTIQLWFTQAPDPAVTAVTLSSDAGEVALGPTTIGDDFVVTSEVPELAPGSYTVTWRSAGDDGHVQRGEFAFSVQTAN